jgi:opacity protein-like surface antigen
MLTFRANSTSSGFHPYIGIDAGYNIADFSTKTEIDNQYLSLTANIGAKIGSSFGAELFFTQSDKTEHEQDIGHDTLTQSIDYQSYGFDVYWYNRIIENFDFFTSFGVANYRFSFDSEYDISDTEIHQSENRVSTRVGIGILYEFTEHFSLLGQYQYAPVNINFINSLSEFSFGIRISF